MSEWQEDGTMNTTTERSIKTALDLAKSVGHRMKDQRERGERDWRRVRVDCWQDTPPGIFELLLVEGNQYGWWTWQGRPDDGWAFVVGSDRLDILMLF